MPSIGTMKIIGSIVGVIAGAATLRRAFEAPIAPGPQRADKAALGTRLIQLIALPIFLFVLFALLSNFVGWLMLLSDQLTPALQDLSCNAGQGLTGRHDHYGAALNAVVCGSVSSALLVLLALGAVGLLLSLRIDTNRFSLHAMYRSRLR